MHFTNYFTALVSVTSSYICTKLCCVHFVVVFEVQNKVQWYLGIRPIWNKSNLVYVLFGREKFCQVYDLCLEYDSRARTCMSQNES
jgi:hypothetical protein